MGRDPTVKCFYKTLTFTFIDKELLTGNKHPPTDHNPICSFTVHSFTVHLQFLQNE